MVKIRIKIDDNLLEQFKKVAAARYGDSEDFLGKAITETMRRHVEEVERMRAALKNHPT
ncbi:hypothetical protein HYV83_04030 [Candidatus Woesearchaeota archaeon]|nr:hypothetical protein [Candidatus Woesearchaeota archaeon]